MRIFVVGNGGREHALVWRLRREAPDAEILFTAGNAGIAELAEPVDLAPEDVAGLVELTRRRGVELAVVGPEPPLAAGLVDALAEARVPTFGPRRAAAEIEWSKAFAKAFMRRHGIPTAAFRTFTDAAAAERHLRDGEGPVVVKASGLMGGKGAIVCGERAEAVEVARAMLAGHLGEAGREIVIEERLEGRELSVIALTDGTTLRPLLPARDHKRALEGDRGPNTGGMGAVAPVPEAGADLVSEVERRVFAPAVRGLAAEGRPFRGALYAGLMLTPEGPRVVEFNARFGDPETQAIVPLLAGSLLDLLLACADPPPRDRSLAELAPAWSPGAACCVVAAATGYPGACEKGLPLDLGTEAPPGPGREAIVFHAGTARAADGRLVTAGGRVLGVTGVGPDARAAREAAYRRLERISFPGMRYRRDIGVDPATAQDGPSPDAPASAEPPAGRPRRGAAARGA